MTTIYSLAPHLVLGQQITPLMHYRAKLKDGKEIRVLMRPTGTWLRFFETARKQGWEEIPERDIVELIGKVEL